MEEAQEQAAAQELQQTPRLVELQCPVCAESFGPAKAPRVPRADYRLLSSSPFAHAGADLGELSPRCMSILSCGHAASCVPFL